ncbi:MAG: glycosyltransferase family 2 protein [Bauldia sp.]
MTAVHFSVVIATYDRGDLILPTIRSVLGQTYPASEILVVGDGCTDGTGEILAANFGERVTWHNLGANGGSQSFANNEGIRRASGTHIAYLGHDDIWSPDHLAALADTLTATGADVAVSGALYHTPPGCDLWYLTGIFDTPSAPAREFFPPSSIAHRSDLTDEIGHWADPSTISRTVDWDLQHRAVTAGCRFASSGRVTVHKFAAGHRYLAYRFPSAREQTEMLDKLADSAFERLLLARVLDRVAHGGIVLPMANPEASKFAPGLLFRISRAGKGLRLPQPVSVTRSMQLELDDTPGVLDWHGVERDLRHGRFRWSGRNPNPVWLVNARIARPFWLRVPIVAVADQSVMASLTLLVNDRPVRPDVTETPDGGFILAVAVDDPMPVAGVKLTFQTWVPGSPAGSVRDRRFALGPIEIVLDDPFARVLRGRS